MTSEKKLLLFISLTENIGSIDSYKLSQDLKGTEVYYYYEKNIQKALKFDTIRTKKMKYYFDNLNFNAKNMSEYIKEYSKLYFLATQSNERYYINPFIIKEGETNLKSLGELLFKFDGQLVPFNSIINKGNYSLEYKKLAVKENVKTYKEELFDMLDSQVKKIKKERLVKRKVTAKNVLSYAEFFCSIFFSAFLFMLFFIPRFYESLIAKPFSSFDSSIIFIYFIGLVIYLSLYIATASWHNRVYETVFYARRFLRIRHRAILVYLEKKCQLLEKHFITALENKKTLKDDIYDFSYYDNKFLDFDFVNKVINNKMSKSYTICSALKTIFFGVMILLILFVSCYLIFIALTKGGLF